MSALLQVGISDVQPSQLFINRAKYNKVEHLFQRGKLTPEFPFPIIKLNDQMVFTDHHTRALVLWRHGISKINVYWDEDAVDLATYQTCVRWCERAGVSRISDLQSRILNPSEYSRQWIQKCRQAKATPE